MIWMAALAYSCISVSALMVPILALDGLGALNLVGADVVEVAPAYDQSEITAIAAAHIACDLLCLWRQKKVAER